MIVTHDAGEVFFVDPELQVIPAERERGLDEGKGPEGGTKPDLEPPDVEETEQAEHITSPDDASPRNGLQMLALSVLELAVREDRHWFFDSRTKDVFRFWAEVAGLNPTWIQQRLERGVETYCPGLHRRGRCCYLDIYSQPGRRQRVKLGGPDLDMAEAVRLGLEHRAARAKSATP